MEALKCEICGGELAQDTQNDLFLCEHCGSKFPKEQVEAAAFDGLARDRAEGPVPLEKLIRNGLTMLELRDYGRARRFFLEAAESNPEDYRGWWYCFVCDTKSFTDIRPDKDMLYKTRELENAFRTAPEGVRPELFRQYRAFAGQCMKMGCELEIASLAAECGALEASVRAIDDVLAKSYKKKRLVLIGTCLAIASVVLFFPATMAFALPTVWILIAPLLVILDFVLFVSALVLLTVGGMGVRVNPLFIKPNEMQRKRLAEEARAKREYLAKLQAYARALPMIMERLTVADILNQKDYVA